MIEKACPKICPESNQPLYPNLLASAYSYVKEEVPDRIDINNKPKYRQNVVRTVFFNLRNNSSLSG